MYKATFINSSGPNRSVLGSNWGVKKKKVMLCDTLEEGRNRSFTIESLRNTNLGNLYYLVWEMKGLGDICYRVPNTI